MKKKSWLDKIVQKEQNIKIREREERKIRRSINILLVILLSGTIIQSWKTFSVLVGVGLTLFLLIFYWLIESKIMNKYYAYTNELIRKSDKK